MEGETMKKLLYKSVALLGVFAMSITTPALAAEATYDEGKEAIVSEDEMSDAEREYWDNLEYEVFDIDAYEDYIDELEANGALEGGISMFATEIAGEWIQAADGRWWYRHTDGTYTTDGWEYIGGQWYYFDSLGWMATGWIYYYENWYYCDTTSGAMQTGWILLNNKSYYMEPQSGIMAKGWVYTNSTWYYCNETSGEWIDNVGTQLIQTARKYEGYPYEWGGDNLATGVDCSGFVVQIHKLHGITVSKRSSAEQYNQSNPNFYGELQPGDLVFSGNSSVSHVSFYMGRIHGVGDQMVISALNEASGICVGKMPGNVKGYGTYWR